MMTLLILVFSALILLAGISILINPEVIFGFLRKNLQKPAIHILAVVVRLIIGGLLINQSSVSKYPFAIEIIAWLLIAAALFLVVMGRDNFHRLMEWALTFFKPYGRIGGVFAVVFGGFLIHAFV